MSGHRRVKDIDYDEDEVDEYSEEYHGDEGTQEGQRELYSAKSRHGSLTMFRTQP